LILPRRWVCLVPDGKSALPLCRISLSDERPAFNTRRTCAGWYPVGSKNWSGRKIPQSCLLRVRRELETSRADRNGNGTNGWHQSVVLIPLGAKFKMSAEIVSFDFYVTKKLL
jgi:hypothetical protein